LTGVVHQHIDTAPGVCNFCNESLDPFAVSDIDSPGNDGLGMLRELFPGFAYGGLAACANRYPCSFSRESLGNGQAYASGCPVMITRFALKSMFMVIPLVFLADHWSIFSPNAPYLLGVWGLLKAQTKKPSKII
jgi:hypothetical protein